MFEDEDIDKISNKVAQKLMVRDIYNAARFLVSMGFHVFSGKEAFKSYIPFNSQVDMDELKNPFGAFKYEDGGFNVDDPARTQLLRRLAKEVYSGSLSGNVAELGVFKGEFAAAIKKAFPDRKLYLFDTFEGFDAAAVKQEHEKFPESKEFNSAGFINTSVDSVLSRIGDAEKCVIKKGLFGDTKASIEDSFVFVNIDTDFYDSILEGLEFFYPRLVPGGYILVHDYSNHDLPGAQQAVRDFCAREKIAFSPCADISAVINKPK